jgi:hypothetical protein
LISLSNVLIRFWSLQKKKKKKKKMDEGLPNFIGEEDEEADELNGDNDIVAANIGDQRGCRVNSAVVNELAARREKGELSGIYAVAMTTPDEFETVHVSVFDAFPIHKISTCKKGRHSCDRKIETPLLSIKYPHSNWRSAGAIFDPTHSRVLMHIWHNTVAVWGPVEQHAPHEYMELYHVVHASFADRLYGFNNAGSRFLGVSYSSKSCAVFDAATGNIVFDRSQEITPELRRLSRAKFAGDDRRIVGLDGTNRLIEVLDSDTGAVCNAFSVALSAESTYVTSMAVGPPHTNLVTTCWDHWGVAVWDYTSGDCLLCGKTEYEPIRSLEFSACGNFLISGHEHSAVSGWIIDRRSPSNQPKRHWHTPLRRPSLLDDGFDDEIGGTPVTSIVRNFEKGEASPYVICMWGNCAIQLDVSTGRELKRAAELSVAIDDNVMLFADAPPLVVLL